jgi:CRISPR-associated protein (TIGR03986 family)
MSVVLVPRLRYTTSIRDLLPKVLWPCPSLNALCPCCRLFGTVGETFQQEQPDGPGKESLAGRIRIGSGVMRVPPKGNLAGRLQMTRLEELGAPHPTCIPFYLKSEGDTNASVGGYDEADVELRGRKFYLHAPEGVQEKDKPYANQSSGHIPKTRRNKTVEALFPADGGNETPTSEADRTQFHFTVDFTNLTAYELGLLCYTLELENNLFHHIGMGKPLGLGTVKIEIDKSKSQIYSRDAQVSRYRSFNAVLSGAATFDVDSCIKEFKRQQAQIKLEKEINPGEEEAQFNEIGYIKDLRYVLSRRPADDRKASIKYPHKEITKGDGRVESGGYVWFKENKKTSEEGVTYEQTLPTLEEIEDKKKKLTDWS